MQWKVVLGPAWAKRIAAALALVFLSTEEIVKYLWHHPEVEHVEVVLPALLPPPPPDFPPGRQLTDGPWLPRWHEERDRETFFAAIGESLRRHRRSALASG